MNDDFIILGTREEWGGQQHFGISPTDAEALHHEFGNTHIAQQFVDLDKFEVLTRLLENGANKEPFRARTLAPVDNPVGRSAKLIAKSRERFSVTRLTVEKRLNRWVADKFRA